MALMEMVSKNETGKMVVNKYPILQVICIYDLICSNLFIIYNGCGYFNAGIQCVSIKLARIASFEIKLNVNLMWIVYLTGIKNCAA